MTFVAARDYVQKLPENFGLSVGQSGMFTFAIKAVFTSTDAGVAHGVVSMLASAINGVANPLLKRWYGKESIDFWHDAAFKVGYFFAATAIANVFLPAVRAQAMMSGLIIYLLLKSLSADADKPVNLNRNSVWILL